MSRTKKITLWGVLLSGIAFSLAAWAIPATGPDEELIITYYSSSDRTEVVGVHSHYHGGCDFHHNSWGVETPYRTFKTSKCVLDGGAY